MIQGDQDYYDFRIALVLLSYTLTAIFTFTKQP